DPFSAEPGARAYLTGDRARWLAGGELEFLGRLDQQVKIRGIRVEPAEIELALATHPEVRDAAVLPDGDPAAPRLVAYVVPHRPGAVTPGALRAFLRDRLPPAVVPAEIVLVEAVQLTAGGKLDRRALAASTTPAASADDHVEPRTPAERRLAALWRELLGRDRVGVHDNFFDIGGHSLLVTVMLARIREDTGVELPAQVLF